MNFRVLVSLVKDTSLAYIVGVPEFTFLANRVNSRLMIYPAQIFVFVGIVYLVLCSALQWVASRVPLRAIEGVAGYEIGYPAAPGPARLPESSACAVRTTR